MFTNTRPPPHRPHPNPMYHSHAKPLSTLLPAQVAINTGISSVNAFLDHIIASTNMRCLTPPRALEGECGYLAANLYAKSVSRI